jgi:GGDEF domain-containing protein
MTNTHSQREEIRAPNADAAAHTFASSLQGLLEVTRAVRSGADVGSVLKTIARAVSDALGYLEGNIDPLLRSLIASFGIATNGSGRSAHELLQVADEAMYSAKRTGTGIEVAA